MDQRVTETHPRLKSAIARSALLALLAAASITGIAVLDWLSEPTLSLTALYLVPVALIAWSFGRRGGHIAALCAAAAELIADAAARGPATDPLAVGWNAGSVLLLSWVVAEVLARLHESLDVERELARTDTLTGAANSRSFAEAMKSELERMSRYGGVFSVAYIDLDHFKLVNDTHGHDAGDRLLRDVAHTIDARLRQVDTVARIGGDEFVMLLPATDESAARTALEAVATGADRPHRDQWRRSAGCRSARSLSRSPRDRSTRRSGWPTPPCIARSTRAAIASCLSRFPTTRRDWPVAERVGARPTAPRPRGWYAVPSRRGARPSGAWTPPASCFPRRT